MIKQDTKSRVLREFLATLQNPLVPFLQKRNSMIFSNFIELTETLPVSLFAL